MVWLLQVKEGKRGTMKSPIPFCSTAVVGVLRCCSSPGPGLCGCWLDRRRKPASASCREQESTSSKEEDDGQKKFKGTHSGLTSLWSPHPIPMETFKLRLDGAMSNMIYLRVPLLIVAMIFRDP